MAVFTAGNANTAGTLTWTPGAADMGQRTVTFTAANALTGAAATTITVLPPNLPPVPTLTATPVTGNEPVTVTADASGSTDPDGSVTSFTFDFGDGTVVGPQTSPTATHTYRAGEWTLAVKAMDDQGASATRTVPVGVGWAPNRPNLVGNSSFESGAANWGPYAGATLQCVTGGFDGGWALQMTGPATVSGFGCNDAPNWIASVPTAGTRYRLTAWVRSDASGGIAKVQIREYAGATRLGGVLADGVALLPWWQRVSVDYTAVAAGSTLDLQVLDAALEPGETFLADDISLYDVTNESVVAVGQPDPGGMPPLVATVAPVPLRTSATITFVTSRPGPLTVGLFDLAGRCVRTVLDEPNAPAGLHIATVNGGDRRGRTLPSGLYFYRIRALEGTSSGRIVIVR
jgi:hypothetical protein